MRLIFSVFEKNFPKKEKVSRAELFNDIGWGDLIANGNFENTCAIRVSVALARCGFIISGRMAIKDGPLKGRRIETGQALLSHILAKRAMLGTPEKFAIDKAEDGLRNRSGIVSFWQLHPGIGDTMGHIDIVSSAGGIKACGTACYWGSKTVWFWPLR